MATSEHTPTTLLSCAGIMSCSGYATVSRPNVPDGCKPYDPFDVGNVGGVGEAEEVDGGCAFSRCHRRETAPDYVDLMKPNGAAPTRMSDVDLIFEVTWQTGARGGAVAVSGRLWVGLGGSGWVWVVAGAGCPAWCAGRMGFTSSERQSPQNVVDELDRGLLIALRVNPQHTQPGAAVGGAGSGQHRLPAGPERLLRTAGEPGRGCGAQPGCTATLCGSR